MTRIKICGLCEVEHALIAARAGADFIGMVFASSKRQVSTGKALQIVKAVRNLKTCPTIVGVFVNSTSNEVNRIANYCDLDLIQLSGDETWQYCHQINRPVIKTIHISDTTSSADIIDEITSGGKVLSPQEFTCLLDSKVGFSYGGTGKAFNWQLAGEVATKFPIIVAGGLSPNNVVELIGEINPWGIDVSSGVETDGKKDAAKIITFIEKARRVTTNIN